MTWRRIHRSHRFMIFALQRSTAAAFIQEAIMAKCEKCQHPLTLGDSDFFCERCGAHYARQAQCPDCHQPLQVLKACGAVDYFCQHGHGLISKKRVEFVPLNYQA